VDEGHSGFLTLDPKAVVFLHSYQCPHEGFCRKVSGRVYLISIQLSDEGDGKTPPVFFVGTNDVNGGGVLLKLAHCRGKRPKKKKSGPKFSVRFSRFPN